MTAVAPSPLSGVKLPRVAPAAIGTLALAAWTAAAIVGPAPAFQGWLIAFAFWSGPSLGALALLCIARLTGGWWGAAFAPELAPAARAAPLLPVLAAPILLALPVLYPWAAAPARVDPSVRTLFLNPAAYAAIGAAALTGWSVVSLRLGRIDRLGAGLALAFHGLAVSLVAVQAIVSIQLGLTNSAAGLSLAAAQLLAGLGFAALHGAPRRAPRPAGDLGGLLVAVALGLSYLVFMGWLVAWYADRPALNGWWGPRTRLPWSGMIVAALTLGLLGPAGLLAARRRLGVRRALLGAGIGAWSGLALYTAWLFAPTYGDACLLPAALAGVAQGGLWFAAVGGRPHPGPPADG